MYVCIYIYIYTHTTESLCFTAEINTCCKINYTSILKNAIESTVLISAFSASPVRAGLGSGLCLWVVGHTG